MPGPDNEPILDVEGRAAEEALQEYGEEIEKYYQKLKKHYRGLVSQHQGNFRFKPIDSLSESNGAVFSEITPRLEVPALNENQRNAISSAVASNNAAKISRILGPVPYDWKFQHKRNDNWWKWIRARCELYVLDTKENVIRRFWIANQFPRTLLVETAEQNAQRFLGMSEQLQQALFSAFNGVANNDVRAAAVVTKWHIPPEFVESVKSHLIDLFKRKRWEAERFPPDRLDETFYVLMKNRKFEKDTCLGCEEKQLQLNETYRKRSQSVPSESRELIIYEPLTLVGTESSSSAYLFRSVLTIYFNAAEASQKDLLPSIKQLFQRGYGPSDGDLRDIKDWGLLISQLKNLTTHTPFSKAVKEKLIEYCKNTKKELSRLILWPFITLRLGWVINLAIKEQRQGDVCEFIVIMRKPREELSAIDIDLIGLIERMLRPAKRGGAARGTLGNSDFCDKLESLRSQWEAGGFVSLSPLDERMRRTVSENSRPQQPRQLPKQLSGRPTVWGERASLLTYADRSVGYGTTGAAVVPFEISAGP